MPPRPDNFKLFAARAMLQRLRKLLRLAPTLGDPADIEPLHDLRVASRRCRSAAGLLEGVIPPAKLETWTQRIRRITRRLREPRDLDVQIAFLMEFEARGRHRAHRPGLDRLILRLRQRRAALTPRLDKTVHEILHDGQVPAMIRELASIHRRLCRKGVRMRTAVVCDIARRQMQTLLGRLRAFEPYLSDGAAIEQHHAMRIAAKRLRYAMETFLPLAPRALRRHIEVLKTIQTFLGDIHDCDVWSEFLPEFMRQEYQRTIDYFGNDSAFPRLQTGLQALLADRRRTRRLLFKQFVAYYRGLVRSRYWAKLQADLDRDGWPTPARKGR